MNLNDKVGNTILKRGDIVKAPSGSSEWVVIKHDENYKVVLACISRYMHKDQNDVKEWYKINELSRK